MVKRNPSFAQLPSSYLFPEVKRRISLFKKENPQRELISLSIGDTSLPLPQVVTEQLKKRSHLLATLEGYQGYGPEQGDKSLREMIAHSFYNNAIAPDDIFISDGAKCDIGRLQILFGKTASIAVQDPSYPVYIDTSILTGQKKIVYLPCSSANDFFPDPESWPKTDLIYLCSPNNPTGHVLNHAQLEQIVQLAKKRGSIILFDAAYSSYIQDPTLPRSIYEIKGAKDVAIEISSFSKFIGFTGIRLGWTVVPGVLKYDDQESVHQDWNRIVSTFFNGASLLSQAGGKAALSKEGIEESRKQIAFYMENAQILHRALSAKYKVYGGQEAPYLWVDFGKKNSWDLFQDLLEKIGVITTPGSGFGPSGEGFLRFTAFGSRASILEAAKRLSLL